MKILKVSTLTLFLGLLAMGSFAQTRTDAVKLFNAGLEEAKAENYDAAISSFTQAITIADQIGAEGEDIKARSQKQIPFMYYYKAREAYANYQSSRGIDNLDIAINAFKDAADVSEEYKDEQVGPLVNRVIPQLYYQKSILYYNADSLKAADEAINQALKLNANYALAYYQKAKIHKKMNDTDNNGIIDQDLDGLLNWYDQAITKAETVGETDVADQSREAAHDELVAVAVQHSRNNEMDQAIDLLSRALTYKQESASAHYRLAEAYNKSEDSDNAITHARQALEYENGGSSDKAKIYYELGMAYQLLGEKDEACDAMTNALYGSFRANAAYKMEHELKCESSAN